MAHKVQATLSFTGGLMSGWAAPPVTPPVVRKRQRTDSDADPLDSLCEKWGPHFTSLKKLRQSYSDEHKEAMANLVDECGGNVWQARNVLLKCGHSIDYQTLKRSKETRLEGRSRRGRPVNATFEHAVLSKCIFQILSSNQLNSQHGRILANILHSLDVVCLAGRATGAEKPFCDDENVQKLQYSRCWAGGVLARHHLRRRSVQTKLDKATMPAPEEIRKMQRATQLRLDDGHRRACDIISADETGINYRVAEKFVYAPNAADRPAADGDEKVRITGMMAGTAEGDMLPAHLIIKCSLDDDGHQANMRVLDNLLPQLPAGEGWQLRTWTGTFQFEASKPEKTFQRKYLINAAGDIITAQNKAWMDSCGLMMWVQLLVVPWAIRNNRRPVIVWDNFQPHAIVDQVIKAGQWTPAPALDLAFELLPPNCTKYLQVMDLIVNSVLKACMRRLRLAHLYDYFQDWRFRYLQQQHLPAEERPKFTPMSIKLKDGVRWFFTACSEAFASEKFKSGMVKCFYKVGLLRRANVDYYDMYPRVHPDTYGKWVDDLRSVACVPTYTDECQSFYLGDLFDELVLANYEAINADDELMSDDEDNLVVDVSDDDDSPSAPIRSAQNDTITVAPAFGSGCSFTNCTISVGGTMNIAASAATAFPAAPVAHRSVPAPGTVSAPAASSAANPAALSAPPHVPRPARQAPKPQRYRSSDA